MTFILICFASELFTLLLSSAILLTPNSGEVNELSRSDGLGLIQDSGFLLSWDCAVQKRGLNRGSLIRNSSSQGKLLLMLNGDYSAELQGQGLMPKERRNGALPGNRGGARDTGASPRCRQPRAPGLGCVGCVGCVGTHQCSAGLLRGASSVPSSGSLFLMEGWVREHSRSLPGWSD